MSIDLLQELGLNKYEAEAYYTLLSEGPLTGYELGKRSQVPLSRSYDVLERLSQKGLALAQPGEPARYRALEPTLFLSQVRSDMEHRLDTLAEELARAQLPAPTGEFWVVRGQRNILLRARTLCAQATHTLSLALATHERTLLADELAQTRQRGVVLTLTSPTEANTIALLSDGHEGLLGALAPADTCQAIYSTNPALVATLLTSFATPAASLSPQVNLSPEPDTAREDWLDWETRKQRRLQKYRADQRSA